VAEKLNITKVIKDNKNRLHGFIRKRVHTLEDADDILQEVFFKLAETDMLMKPIDHVAAWLFTVARNRITDLYRKKKAEPLPEFLSDDEDDVTITELRDLLFDEGSTPETEYLRSLVWIELEKALNELPPEQRQVFEMNELQDIPFKEIALQTGETINTLISRKRYAVLHLRERLQILYNELITF
jgi:RNA polymerase sigma factor (sigma-70 family)